MTTKNSPLAVLKAQADDTAIVLKLAERGHAPAGQFRGARAKPSIKVGLAMDDGLRICEIKWEDIARLTLAELSDYIVTKMREEKPN